MERRAVKRTHFLSCLIGAVGAAALAGPTFAGSLIRINEIRIDQPGADNDEYFELKGPPGASLDGLTYLVIGDGTGGSGVIEAVVNLTGNSINSSGYFLVTESTFTLAGTPDLVVGATGLNFENGDNVTHLLVSGFSGSNADDLDLDDDGVLDVTPWTGVLDAIGMLQQALPPSTTEWAYGASLGFEDIGPDGVGVPGHIYRCETSGDWSIGTFDLTGLDTPGADNGACIVPKTGIVISEIRIDQPGTDFDEYFELRGEPGASLDGLTYIVIGDGSGAQAGGVIEAVIPLTGYQINANGYFLVVEETFTLSANFDLMLPGTNPLNFENADNVTHLLVAGFTGTSGLDLDVDEDGVLDSTPWTDVLDAIGIYREFPPTQAGEDWVYGASLGFEDIGPDGAFHPVHVYRCVPDDTWQIGRFDIVGLDTPGEANADCLLDFDGDGIPDDFDNCPDHPNPDQADCDNDGIGDVCAIAFGFSLDCNGNGIPDECDIASGFENDCNQNGIPDSCDFAEGILTDGNGDGIADECFVTPPTGLRINEIRIDQPGVDNDEYFELKGNPGTALSGLRYIVLGDDAIVGNSGVVEAVINLDNLLIPFDGHFLAVESTFTLAPLAAANLVLDAAQNILNFENSDNVTHLLVANWTGSLGQDLDLDDDGVLDITPWSHVIDAVGLIVQPNPPTSTEYAYGAALGFEDVGPDGTFVPGHIYRCESAGTWTIGAFDPSLSVDTPGSLNESCGTGTPCPADLDDDGQVGFTDVLLILSNWGPCSPPCPIDLDGDNNVGFTDLLVVLSNWGPCP